MSKKLSLLVVVVLLAGFVVPALAAVVFNPETGNGFVGKGDVQEVLSLNNAGLQEIAEDLEFTFVSTITYGITEVWASGNESNVKSLNYHEVSETIIYSVNGSVLYDARKANQVNGFILNGYNGSPTVIGGALPTVDEIYWVTFSWTDNKGEEHVTDELPAREDGSLYNANDKAVMSVEIVSSTGGLFVNGVLLP